MVLDAVGNYFSAKEQERGCLDDSDCPQSRCRRDIQLIAQEQIPCLNA